MINIPRASWRELTRLIIKMSVIPEKQNQLIQECLDLLEAIERDNMHQD
jgi:hypothetical protein